MTSLQQMSGFKFVYLQPEHAVQANEEKEPCQTTTQKSAPLHRRN
jgi:hypothetical protein